MSTAIRSTRLMATVAVAITLAVLLMLMAMTSAHHTSPGGYVAQSTAAVLN